MLPSESFFLPGYWLTVSVGGAGDSEVQEGCPVKDQRLCSLCFIHALSNYFRTKNGSPVQRRASDAKLLEPAVSLS